MRVRQAQIDYALANPELINPTGVTRLALDLQDARDSLVKARKGLADVLSCLQENVEDPDTVAINMVERLLVGIGGAVIGA